MKKEDVNGCFNNMILIDKSELNSIFGANVKNQLEKNRIINIILEELEYIMKKIKEGI